MAYPHRRVGIGTPGCDHASSRKLRIGYVSSDLREHAVGFGMTDVLETHDKQHFEIYAYYCGINRSDPTQVRIKDSVDHWLDINGLSDQQAAKRIAEDRIDILIDLNGYTRDARTKVFALQPAPIIVKLVRIPRHDGKSIPSLPHRRSLHHSGRAGALLLGEGAAVAVLSAQRPQATWLRLGVRRGRTRACPRMPSSIAASTACRRSRQPSFRRG